MTLNLINYKEPSSFRNGQIFSRIVEVFSGMVDIIHMDISSTGLKVVTVDSKKPNFEIEP
jgi:hypothetical protein